MHELRIQVIQLSSVKVLIQCDVDFTFLAGAETLQQPGVNAFHFLAVYSL